MTTTFKSIMKPEGSLLMGAAVAGMVFAIYQLNIGSCAEAHATQPNHPALETCRKKAGYSALIMVAGLALLAKDPNMIILGGAAIIGMEVQYRHAIMVHPETGEMVPPAASSYLPAQNVVPLGLQAQAG